jgi:two-component system OmpR family sensor kinase
VNTIRRRLITGLLCATIVCTAGAGTLLYRFLLDEANELADLQLRQLAVALPDEFAPQLGHSAPEDPEEQFSIEAWDSAGKLVHSSSLAPYPLLPRQNLQGFGYVKFDGMDWRVYGVSRRDRHVQVAQPMKIRNELAAAMALRSGAPLLVFVVLLMMLVLWVARDALRPLNRLAATMSNRSPATLNQLDTHSWPAELKPIVAALNTFMLRIASAMDAQRTFVADAAHELRSPLTALKLQLQLAEREQDDAARAAAMGRVQERLDRSSHLVQQLLDLAAHETGYSGAQLTRVDVEPLLAATVVDFSPLADSRDIDIGLVPPAEVQLLAHREGVQLMLNNLVDNALRYTQRGGRVDLAAWEEGGEVVLAVSDNGPGIAEAHRERVFERFYRPEGMDVTGCGLGLSIVRNIADHHRARIVLENGSEGRGLAVKICFPAPDRK